MYLICIEFNDKKNTFISMMKIKNTLKLTMGVGGEGEGGGGGGGGGGGEGRGGGGCPNHHSIWVNLRETVLRETVTFYMKKVL